MNNHSFKSSLARYLAIVGVYLIALTVLKAVEYSTLGIGDASVWLNGTVYNLVVASWAALGIGGLYLLIRLLSEKVATAVVAVLFALLLLAEVGLTMYVRHNGFLLGCELVARPLGETLTAIRGAVGVLLPLAMTLLLMGGFVALALWRAKRPSKAAWAVAVVMGVMMLLSLIFKLSHLVKDQYAYYILNKTHHLVADSYDYLRTSHTASASGEATVAYDGALVAELLATHPEWGQPMDSLYPLERPTPAGAFLSPYFRQGTGQAPNVVVILVESLGADMMHTGAMPFVDSLAATGIYFPNCLSTTTRSYGAVPAITGSVGGPRCFQFGIMPDHNSLFSLLKAAGYNTRAYYTGDFNFDCIYEYLSAQQVDYLSPLYEEYKQLPASQQTNWWGYEDDTLFHRTLCDLADLSRRAPKTPFFSLVITMTMHEPMQLANETRQRDYDRRASQIPHKAGEGKLPTLFPACLFTDDALRQFFRDYSQLPGYENTLFVVTGDHSSGRKSGDQLSYHHVPLILWSPLLERNAEFRHVVTHNDVAPALYRLLTTHYDLPSHPSVHWLGDDLGPTPKTLLVVNYVHSIQEIVYHSYYYQAASRTQPEHLYRIGTDLQLHPCTDTTAMHTCRRQLELMRYLYSYTYLTNHLTAHPTAAREYTTVQKGYLHNEVRYAVPLGTTAESEPPMADIITGRQLLGTKDYSTVRVTIEADATVEGNWGIDQYPNLIFSLGSQWYFTPSAKAISGDGRFYATKEFALNPTQNNNLHVSLNATKDPHNWQPGSSLTLSNILITIEYGK